VLFIIILGTLSFRAELLRRRCDAHRQVHPALQTSLAIVIGISGISQVGYLSSGISNVISHRTRQCSRIRILRGFFGFPENVNFYVFAEMTCQKVVKSR